MHFKKPINGIDIVLRGDKIFEHIKIHVQRLASLILYDQIVQGNTSCHDPP